MKVKDKIVVFAKNGIDKVCKVSKKHASVILTVTACTGVVATAVLAAKAKTKADNILAEIDMFEYSEERPMSNVEKFKQVAPAYIPTVISGAITIASIIGLNYYSEKRIQNLLAAYELTKAVKDEYKGKLNNYAKNDLRYDADSKDISESDEEIEAFKKAKAINKPKKKYSDDEDIPYMDMITGQLFYSNKLKIKEAVADMNNRLFTFNTCSLNEILTNFNVPYGNSIAGDVYGWDITVGDHIEAVIHRAEETYDGLVYRPVEFNATACLK